MSAGVRLQAEHGSIWAPQCASRCVLNALAFCMYQSLLTLKIAEVMSMRMSMLAHVTYRRMSQHAAAYNYCNVGPISTNAPPVNIAEGTASSILVIRC